VKRRTLRGSSAPLRSRLRDPLGEHRVHQRDDLVEGVVAHARRLPLDEDLAEVKHQVGDPLRVDLPERSLGHALVEHPTQQTHDASLLLAGERVRDGREAHLHVASEREAHDVIARVGPARDLDDPADLPARSLLGGEHARRLLDERLGVLVEQPGVEILLVAEMRVERGPRAPRLTSNLVHRRLRDPEAEEAPSRSLEDVGTGAVLGLRGKMLGLGPHFEQINI
jgi:hypothetical protein